MNMDIVVTALAIVLAILVLMWCLAEGRLRGDDDAAVRICSKRTSFSRLEFGTWSKVALWLIVILLGINVCLMVCMRNQTANLHKDIHKIMGVDASALICRDRMNPRMWYPTER